MERDESRLSPIGLAGFSVAAVPAQFAYVLVLIMYLKYAVDDLGASAAGVGTIFLVAKFWDAVSDPLVGNWSDRTTLSVGRRRSWLFLSAPMLALFGAMLWAPPAGLGEGALLAWIGVGVLGFYTAYTVFEVPHMALGAELTFARDQRNLVYGLRQAMRTVGMFAAGTIGVRLVGQGRASAGEMALWLGVVTLVVIIGGIAAVPRERAEFVGKGGENPLRATRDVLANRHARLLLGVFFIENIGLGGTGVLTPFVIEYVVGREDLVPVMLAAYMGSALLGVPLWLALGRRFEKRRLWLAAMIQSGVGYGLIFWVGEGDWLLVLISSIAAGIASSCSNTLGQALKADLIDMDEYRTGQRKEGTYFAAWSFVGKFAAGIMIGIVGYTLEWVGYVENAAQTEETKAAMVFLMGGLPLIGFTIGSIAFARFDLSEAEHARVLHELEARTRAGESAGG